ANAVYQISTQETGSENFTLLAYRLPDKSDGDHESTNESNSELHRLNDELAARNEELLEIVASRDKFISIIAHDIKNPFTALLGFSEFLFKNIDNVDKEEIEEIARAMFQSSRLIFSFLENLLQWARLRTDRIEFNPVMIDLYAVTEGITELLTDNAQLKDITLSNAIPEGTWVFADEPSISSVLRNLISNAIKFSRKGGKVTLSSQIKDDYVHVQVSDSGVGMRQEDVAKIFRIDKSHTTVGTNNERGTGLGLKLCKEFVERNGGTIWVESTLNKGSIFTFTLYRKVKAEMV
ncbi:partial Alkaline phosphatase synthesis sensor protein PhoR, partial [uncultured bacterium]